MQSETIQKPWYKEFWVWFLIAIPLSSIIFGFYMLSIAIIGADTLVRDNYYKDGLLINEELALDENASRLNLSATLEANGAPSQPLLLISLENLPEGYSGTVKLDLIHPTLAESDHSYVLIPERGRYVTQMDQAINGVRYIQLTDVAGQWRLKAKAAFPLTHSVQLEPSVPK